MSTTYDDDHFLLTFGGYLVKGHESWQCGLRYAAPGGTPDAAYEAALGHISMVDIYTAARTWIQNATSGSQYDQWTSLEFVKLAFLGVNGRYKADPIEHRQTSWGTATPGNAQAPQLSVVFSLSSGTKIGNANHGRIFLPLPDKWATAIDPVSGMVVPSYINALRVSTLTMLEVFHGEVSTVEAPTQLCIFSPRTADSSASLVAQHKPVVQVGIGSAVDTQRSRRRSLPDGITSWTSYAPSGG